MKRYPQTMIELFALGVMAVGILVSLSWITGFENVKSLIPTGVTMKFSTAISFSMSGLALFAISRHMIPKLDSHLLSEVVLPSSLLVIVLFMTTHLASMILSTPAGVDNLFVTESPDALYTSAPGRPSLGTISSFMLVAAAGVIALTMPYSKIRTRVLLGIGLSIGIIGAIALAGYTLNLSVLYYLIPNSSTAMAIHTAALFVAIGFILVHLAKLQSRFHDIAKPMTGKRQISIRTRMIALFLVVSIIPIVFIGTIVLNNAKTLPSDILAGSVAILAVTTVLSAAFFALVLSRSISNPIFSLRNAVNLITAGKYDTQIPIENLDELGQLANDFKKMKETVAATNRNLERLVKLRTLELADSNKQLAISNKQLIVANEQLKIQEKKMQDFINVAAHELRNPIAPILMTTSLIVDKEKAENGKVILTNDEFGMIVRNAERLKRLAEDILDVTRIDSQSLKLTKERFDISALIASVIDDSKKLSQHKNVRITNHSEKESIMVEADRDKIVQVISNLLANAIKFVESGTITVTARLDEKNDQIVVSVKDTGKGIDPEILPVLFSKFVTKSQKGMGLGLYISKSIVEAHGGKIWAENNMNEKGAKFMFCLPLSQ